MIARVGYVSGLFAGLLMGIMWWLAAFLVGRGPR